MTTFISGREKKHSQYTDYISEAGLFIRKAEDLLSSRMIIDISRQRFGNRGNSFTGVNKQRNH